MFLPVFKLSILLAYTPPPIPTLNTFIMGNNLVYFIATTGLLVILITINYIPQFL